MDHPDAVRFRSAFDDLWERGDLEPAMRLLRDDVVWINDIGAGPFTAGDGKESVLTLFAEWTALFDGGFVQELVDICASDHNVVEILHEVGTARGQRFDNLALYRYELDDNGLVNHVRTYDRDREAIDAFWAAVGIAPEERTTKMAIGMYFSSGSFTPEQYDEANRRMEAAGALAPNGRRYHVALESDGQIQVFHVWESEELFRAFGATLLPVLADLGIDPGEPHVSSVHNIIEG